MLSRIASLVMLYAAYTLMLGHNFVPHHHHSYEHYEESNQHEKGHHHPIENQNKSINWSDFFSGIQHTTEDFTFLSAYSSTLIFLKLTPDFTTCNISNIIFHEFRSVVHQNSTPYIFGYYYSHIYPPSGLRAPPICIV